MKKRILSFILCILTLFSFTCILASCDRNLLEGADETLGLYFFPLPDGNYGVKAGTALYLDKIEIPTAHNIKLVTRILPSAFEGAYNLASITIPDYVERVEEKAFADCSSLTSVIIPASVTKIGEEAFADCGKLTSINFKGTEQQWNAITKGDGWDSGAGAYTVTYNYTIE